MTINFCLLDMRSVIENNCITSESEITLLGGADSIDNCLNYKWVYIYVMSWGFNKKIIKLK